MEAAGAGPDGGRPLFQEKKAYRPKRVWEAAAAAAAVDAAAAHKEQQGQYWSRNLYALVEEQEQRRRWNLVLSTRDWIKRAKANLLSGLDIGVRVGEQSCGLGR
ncbi:hypothetical protein GOP47_0020188 [Adiantum capillus-veneris]|uniref:Uncharacterized protein n=1 Tax=Adiantum capillus-veneris TaxID=13818 RepID=A0A9D4UDG1_ADICA|nr:hypothetical protein GOP47_0020188 [Adiantum capillus-veneris]